ncbi:MAG TPA: molybdopterin-synthase adenylyltransferase MoeB [Candidatus Saccharimonadales bacterium]|nr:molybdopterin-synthase adenylyltransferase MoeB [Candidatus Saccharimonadales bacterium]
MSTQHPLPPLSPAELRRYGRHLLLPELGLEGQRRLKAGRVLLVGAGGLGSPLALYLAAAGVGTLGIADPDVVDETNLHRQVLHGTPQVGRPKTESARETVSRINPHVQVELHPVRLDRSNALAVLGGYDVVADGSDNFPTRYLVNDACVLLGKPDVYGSVFRFEGQASVFALPGGPCYRCLHPVPPPPGLVASCAEAGVLGVLPGLIGLVQATEVIKLLAGVGEPLAGRLLLYDALSMTFQTLQVRRDPECPACGDHPQITELVDYEELCGAGAAGEEAAADVPGLSLSPGELRARLDRGETPLLLDVREPVEYQIARLPGARLIPLGQLPARAGELDPGADIVAYCHHGQRSLEAVRYLRAAGFPRVLNLAGGIDAWAATVDPGMPRY